MGGGAALFPSIGPSVPLDGPEARAAMAALADQINTAGVGQTCIVAWQNKGDYATVVAPERFSREQSRTILAAIDHEFTRCKDRPTGLLHLQPSRVGSLIGEAGAIHALACATSDGNLRSVVILLTLHPEAASDSLLSLAANSALAIAARADLLVSRDFWRERAMSLGEQMALAKDNLAERLASDSEQTRVVAEARKLPPGKRFPGLGAVLAQAGASGAWIVVTRADRELRVAAASAPLATLPQLTDDGPLAGCIREQRVIIRNSGPRLLDHEDRFFADFPGYICLPFSHGAIALATSRDIPPEARARLDQLTRALDPVFERWLAEAEIERLQELVRSLGLRMFTAIDSERQRIARDLHDDQAQLLTAARLALETDQQQARAILKQLDEALRRRVRELRPATLGRTKLVDAIGLELDRLAAAGIKGRLLGSRRAATLNRSAQELCYQILREAFSNILRHSGARNVTVSIRRIDDKVILHVDDDGVGPARESAGSLAGKSGMGLTGMAERLQLMGGTLSLDRLDGKTRLTAEIPQF